jgi:NitT/TauT family transport system permease protein
MTRRLDPVCLLAAVLALLALALPLSSAPAGARWSDETSAVAAILLLALTSGWFARAGASRFGDGLALLGVGAIGSWAALALVHGEAGIAGQAGWGFWVFILALWAAIWRAVDAVAKVESLDQSVQRTRDLIVPVAFGLWLLFLWEIGTLGFGVPQVLLPPPSAVAERIAASSDILVADFHQTFVKSVLSGYAIGCGAGLAVAVLVDRFDFPQARAAAGGKSGQRAADHRHRADHGDVVRLRLAVEGRRRRADDLLPDAGEHAGRAAAAGALERDLMRSYAAGYWQTLREAAPAGGDALHLQCAEDQLDAGADRRDRGRVLRHADRRHGLSHLHRGGAHEYRHGLGADRHGGARRLGLLWTRRARRARRRPSGIRQCASAPEIANGQ